MRRLHTQGEVDMYRKAHPLFRFGKEHFSFAACYYGLDGETFMYDNGKEKLNGSDSEVIEQILDSDDSDIVVDDSQDEDYDSEDYVFCEDERLLAGSASDDDEMDSDYLEYSSGGEHGSILHEILDSTEDDVKWDRRKGKRQNKEVKGSENNGAKQSVGMKGTAGIKNGTPARREKQILSAKTGKTNIPPKLSTQQTKRTSAPQLKKAKTKPTKDSTSNKMKVVEATPPPKFPGLDRPPRKKTKFLDEMRYTQPRKRTEQKNAVTGIGTSNSITITENPTDQRQQRAPKKRKATTSILSKQNSSGDRGPRIKSLSKSQSRSAVARPTDRRTCPTIPCPVTTPVMQSFQDRARHRQMGKSKQSPMEILGSDEERGEDSNAIAREADQRCSSSGPTPTVTKDNAWGNEAGFAVGGDDCNERPGCQWNDSERECTDRQCPPWTTNSTNSTEREEKEKSTDWHKPQWGDDGSQSNDKEIEKRHTDWHHARWSDERPKSTRKQRRKDDTNWHYPAWSDNSPRSTKDKEETESGWGDAQKEKRYRAEATDWHNSPWSDRLPSGGKQQGTGDVDWHNTGEKSIDRDQEQRIEQRIRPLVQFPSRERQDRPVRRMGPLVQFQSGAMGPSDVRTPPDWAMSRGSDRRSSTPVAARSNIPEIGVDDSAWLDWQQQGPLVSHPDDVWNSCFTEMKGHPERAHKKRRMYREGTLATPQSKSFSEQEKKETDVELSFEKLKQEGKNIKELNPETGDIVAENAKTSGSQEKPGPNKSARVLSNDSSPEAFHSVSAANGQKVSSLVATSSQQQTKEVVLVEDIAGGK